MQILMSHRRQYYLQCIAIHQPRRHRQHLCRRRRHQQLLNNQLINRADNFVKQ
jgi:hypothetical protein